MNKPDLHIVKPNPESVAEKVRRLQREARECAVAYIADALADLERLTAKAQEIAAGGEAFPDGVRQEMAQLAREMERRATTISAIVGRAA